MVRFPEQQYLRAYHHTVIAPGQGSQTLAPEIDSMFDHDTTGVNAARARGRAAQIRGTYRPLKEGDVFRENGVLKTHGGKDGPLGPADHRH